MFGCYCVASTKIKEQSQQQHILQQVLQITLCSACSGEMDGCQSFSQSSNKLINFAMMTDGHRCRHQPSFSSQHASMYCVKLPLIHFWCTMMILCHCAKKKTFTHREIARQTMN